MRGIVARGAGRPTIPRSARRPCGSREAIDALERATDWLLARVTSDARAALAGATPYLRLFGNAAGGACSPTRRWRLSASADGNSADRIARRAFLCREYRRASSGLETTVTEGAELVTSSPLPGEAA